MTFTATLTNNFSPSFRSRLKTKVRLSAFKVKKRFFFYFMLECYIIQELIKIVI